jgi:predicted Zn-dependent protease
MLLLATSFLGGCGINPVTGERELQFISEGQEIKIGEEQYGPSQQMQGGDLSIDPELNSYVQRVGERLARVADRQLPYEFVVLNNSVPNAWALPGGKIAVNRGLLQELKCEAELAAVLGHEITHAAARHGAQSAERGMLLQGALLALQIGVMDNQYANLIVGGAALGANLITTKYGRDAEREADLYGMRYMKRAGYDPAAAVELQRTFVRLSEGKGDGGGWLAGLFATHPPSAERVQNNLRTLEELGAGGEQGCEDYTVATANLRKLQPAYAKYDAGVLALSKGDLAAAQAQAREALAIESREPKFHELLGDVALARKDFAESLKHYERARELNPDYFKPYLAAGIASFQLKRRDEAARLLDRSMELLPTATGAYYLGRIAQDTGDVERAIKLYELAAQSDSDVGRASARELLQLDLPRNPGRYVRLEPRIDRSGRVWILVQNGAPVPIENVVIAAAIANPAGGLAQGPVQLSTGLRTLAPNEVAQLATPLGPLRDAQALQLVRAQVERAQVAR